MRYSPPSELHSVAQEIPVFNRTQRFIDVLVYILSQVNPVPHSYALFIYDPF
jgi:hypothetical protein